MKIRSKCDRCGNVGPERMIDKDCPNLWEPQACAGTMKRYEILEHVGLYAERLKFENAHRERAFAKTWAEENRQDSLRPPTLTSLLGRKVTQEEATLAATLMQWLGSNCGQAFIHAASVEARRSESLDRLAAGD